METGVGIFISAVGLIIMINQYRINDVIKTLTETTTRLDTRISEESIRTDKEIEAQYKHYLSDLNGVAERLGSQIKGLSDSVIYRDVFEQHEKAEDARYIGIEKILIIIEKQMETSSSTNSQEHNRMIKKIDDIPNHIAQEIDRLARN